MGKERPPPFVTGHRQDPFIFSGQKVATTL
jgi:hypothetical protein